MLLEVIKPGEVVSCRLSTGEELVGTLKSESAESVELSKPLIVGRSENGFGLMPYMMTVSPESMVKISLEHIMTLAKTNEEITKGYQKQTSDIITWTKDSIQAKHTATQQDTVAPLDNGEQIAIAI